MNKLEASGQTTSVIPIPFDPRAILLGSDPFVIFRPQKTNLSTYPSSDELSRSGVSPSLTSRRPMSRVLALDNEQPVKL